MMMYVFLPVAKFKIFCTAKFEAEHCAAHCAKRHNFIESVKTLVMVE